jgi:NAD(P)-dependent dehydrogenase (short-subunit alcohol dehydrogenase family)
METPGNPRSSVGVQGTRLANGLPMTETPRLLTPAAKVPPLEGQVILITGAASGLGRCVGAVLGEAGARVVLADLALPKAQSWTNELTERGIRAQALELDVGDAKAVERAIALVQERFGRLDAAINSAAIDVTAPISELDVVQWERIVRTNLNGPFLVSKYAAAAMVAAPAPEGGSPVRGHIVNICSTASKRAWPNACAYHATKWGLLGLSHALHAELRSQGVKVCALVAGGMRTPFLLERFPDIDPGLLQDPMNVAHAVRYVLTQPDETVIPEMTVLPMRETSWP